MSPKKGADAALLAAGWLSCAAAHRRSAVWPLLPVTFPTIKANILSLFVFVGPSLPSRKSWRHIIRDNWDERSQKCGMNCAHMGRHGSVFFFSCFTSFTSAHSTIHAEQHKHMLQMLKLPPSDLPAGRLWSAPLIRRQEAMGVN